MLKQSLMAIALATAAIGGASGAAQAKGKMTLYCSPQIEWCNLMVEAFEKETGIKVEHDPQELRRDFRPDQGGVHATPRATSGGAAPVIRILQAAEEGLTQSYDSPMRGELHDWAISQSEFGQRQDHRHLRRRARLRLQQGILEKNGLPVPKCWKDLTKPIYKGQVQMANPNSSGTAYTTLATIVQIFGEDEGFDFMKAPAQEHQHLHQVRLGADQGGGLAARTPSASCSCTTWSRQTVKRLPDRRRGALRRHRLRGRLDEHHQGCAQPGIGQEVL